MKVTFLGTGTSHGVPVIGCQCEVCVSTDPKDKRLRSSVLIETDGQTFVIDTGPDFRQQMLRENVRSLDAVVFTHEHKDHTAGLDDVRAFNYQDDSAMDVYATARVIDNLRRSFDYIFADHTYPGIPRLDLHEIENRPFFIREVEWTPVLVYHYHLPVFGFRIKDFTYITDANAIPDEEKEKIYGSRALVLNALRITPHISHFSLDEAVVLAKELKVENVYFTHISHQLGKHADVEATLPQGIHLGYDGLKLDL